MDAQIIIPIIVAVIMAIPGIASFFVQFRKESTEANKLAQEAMLEIIQPLRDEIKRLRERIAELESSEEAKAKRIEYLEGMYNRVAELEKEVTDKDARIAELERLVAEKDAQIATMENEIVQLGNRIEKVEKLRPKTTPIKKG